MWCCYQPECLHRQGLLLVLPSHLQNLFRSLPQPPLRRLLLTLLLLALAGLQDGRTVSRCCDTHSHAFARQLYLSLGLSEQATEALVPQGPVGELFGLAGLGLLQPQLELPQGVQLLHQLPLTGPAGLEVQLQVQGGPCWLLGQWGAVRLLRAHAKTHLKQHDGTDAHMIYKELKWRTTEKLFKIGMQKKKWGMILNICLIIERFFNSWHNIFFYHS